MKNNSSGSKSVKLELSKPPSAASFNIQRKDFGSNLATKLPQP
jgi:hypothetical protein